MSHEDLLFTITAGDVEKPETMRTIEIYTTGQVKGLEGFKDVSISNRFTSRYLAKLHLEESRGNIVIVR